MGDTFDSGTPLLLVARSPITFTGSSDLCFLRSIPSTDAGALKTF